MKATFFRKTNLKHSVLLIFIAFICACTGEDGMDGIDGSDGENGVAGEVGPAGQDGADGLDGADGENGNANVIASEWIPSAFSGDRLRADSMEIFDDTITQEYLDSAVLLTYGRANTIIQQLPFTIISFVDNGFRELVVYKTTYSLGRLQIIGTALDGNEFRFVAFSFYRYIIIPSNSSTGKSSKQNILRNLKQAGVDVNNYQQVADYYGLN